MTDLSLIREAAGRWGTPLYIFDLDCVHDRVRRFREGLRAGVRETFGEGGPEISLTYSMKTNPFLTRAMADWTDRVEVCSMGEFRICRDLRIPPEKLFISGVLKIRADLEEILDYGTDRARYTAESPQQARYLSDMAAARGLRVRVWPRLTNGSQFGMDEDTILEMIREADRYPGLIFEGIHFFSGTQKKKLSRHARELQMLDAFFLRLKEEAGYTVPALEYGTGFAVSYFEDQKKEADLREPDQLAAFCGLLAQMQWRGQVIIEMGRAYAAECGTYVTTALDTKVNNSKRFCLVDGGIHQLQYDGQIKGMYRPRIRVIPAEGAPEPAQGEETVTICGSLCTMNDVLCSAYPGAIREGDLVAFMDTGAYSFYEGMSLFLSHELPAVVLRGAGEGWQPCRLRTETYPMNMPRP